MSIRWINGAISCTPGADIAASVDGRLRACLRISNPAAAGTSNHGQPDRSVRPSNSPWWSMTQRPVHTVRVAEPTATWNQKPPGLVVEAQRGPGCHQTGPASPPPWVQAEERAGPFAWPQRKPPPGDFSLSSVSHALTAGRRASQQAGCCSQPFFCPPPGPSDVPPAHQGGHGCSRSQSPAPAFNQLIFLALRHASKASRRNSGLVGWTPKPSQTTRATATSLNRVNGP